MRRYLIALVIAALAATGFAAPAAQAGDCTVTSGIPYLNAGPRADQIFQCNNVLRIRVEKRTIGDNAGSEWIKQDQAGVYANLNQGAWTGWTFCWVNSPSQCGGANVTQLTQVNFNGVIPWGHCGTYWYSYTTVWEGWWIGASTYGPPHTAYSGGNPFAIC